MDYSQRLEPTEMMQRNLQPTDVVERWITANLTTHGYERFDELHIDQIDSKWRDPNSWIEGGLDAFQLAKESRDRCAPNFTVVLAFSLIADTEPRGVDFQSLEELKAQLNSSPPSLYLFRSGKEPWTDTVRNNRRTTSEYVETKELDPSPFKALGEPSPCHYMEFKKGDFDEYDRSLLVAG